MTEARGTLILKPLTSQNIKEKNIVSIDIETIGDTNIFYLGGLYDSDGYKSFYDKEEMIQYILTNKKYYTNTIIVATNLGFDFNALFFGCERWNDFKIIMRGGDMLSSEIKNNKNQKLKFIDSMNYIKFGVEKLGEIIGIKKLKQPKCLGKLPMNTEEIEELEKYNEQDCLITKKFMEFFQNSLTILGCKMQLTIASSSMDLFRRKFLKRWIIKEDYVLKRNKENSINPFIFKAYYGGRTEIFQRGLFEEKDTNLKCFDINSLYPSVMRNSFPSPSSAKYSTTPTKELLQFHGVSRIKIYSPIQNDIPILPYRDENDKLIFPHGTFTGTYTHLEINEALKKGYKIIEMYETLYYTRNFYPFKDFVETLYNKRLEYQAINNPMELVVKTIMNSTYGKFAQKGYNETQIIDLSCLTPEQQANKDLLLDCYTIDGIHFIKNNFVECEKNFVIPILSVYVTAYARLKLYSYLEIHNPVYCDTDSIYTYDDIPTSNKLGEMKLEYNILKAIMIKPKMYYLLTDKKEVIRLKGVSRMNSQMFYQVMNKEMIHFEKFTKLKESVRQGYSPNTILQCYKVISLEDTKREWSYAFNEYDIQKSKPLYICE